ncbi:MAG: hypothetical protein AB8G96_12735 [Phycisphaerales bacterium]
MAASEGPVTTLVGASDAIDEITNRIELEPLRILGPAIRDAPPCGHGSREFILNAHQHSVRPQHEAEYVQSCLDAAKGLQQFIRTTLDREAEVLIHMND